MKMIKHFIPIVFAFVLVAGLLVQASIEEIFPTGKVTDRRAFLEGVFFAQQEIRRMRREGHDFCGRILRDQEKILAGLEGAMVVIGGVGPDGEKYGLTRQLLQTDVELRLRMHGIKVHGNKVGTAIQPQDKKVVKQTIVDTTLQHWRQAINAKSDEDFLQSAREWVRWSDFSESPESLQRNVLPYFSMLSIKLYAIFDEERHHAVFSIGVELQEGAYLCRNGAFWQTPIWEKRSFGTSPSSDLKEYVRGCLRDSVDKFINDYYAANPKDSSSQNEQ